MRYEGSLINRLMEQTDQSGIKLVEGMRFTRTLWSDRMVYEILKVKDQKHLLVREMKAIAADENPEMGHQNWILTSDENMKVRQMNFKYNKWCFESVEQIGDKSYKHREVVTPVFGVADYYYDWEF